MYIELDLEAIELRVNAATQGPWIGFLAQGSAWVDENDYDAQERGGGIAELSDTHLADAKFIAAARTDVPLLIAEIRRLRELIATGLTNDPAIIQFPIWKWFRGTLSINAIISLFSVRRDMGTGTLVMDMLKLKTIGQFILILRGINQSISGMRIGFGALRRE